MAFFYRDRRRRGRNCRRPTETFCQSCRRLRAESLEDRRLLAGGAEVPFGVVAIQSDAGHANELVLSVDDQGWLRHSWGGHFGFASDIDVDAATPGVQARRVTEIGQLTYCDLDAAADDDVTIDAGLLDLSAGSLSIRAGMITVNGDVRARNIAMASAGLTNIAAGASLRARDGAAGGCVEIHAHVLVQAGELHADGDAGGHVLLEAARVLSSSAVTADGRDGAGGRVEIDFAENYVGTVAAVVSAGGTTDGGMVRLNGGNTGRLFTSGRMATLGQANAGGEIGLFGRELVLVAATADASGEAAGGRILIGGDHPRSQAVPAARTVETSGVTLRADGAAGGAVVVWSDESTTFGGSLSASGRSRGPDANSPAGGFIEVSSRGKLVYAGTADAGVGGTLLLDPKNLVIDAVNGVFPQFDLVNPTPSSGDRFGSMICPLATGNVVVTDNGDDVVATDAGAAYLYDGLTGALISVLVGSSASDQVGSVTALSNGNYVIGTLYWDNGGAADAGAVTWGSGATGVSGVVSSSNSLVGSSSSDRIGTTVNELANGNYVVGSWWWNGSRGAATWGSGTAGVRGVISSSNSLIGSYANDQVGFSGVVPLTNGNYVVRGISWNSYRGAVTWGNGTTGITGTISSSNSLVGANFADWIGYNGVTPLSNGNYVICSSPWNGSRGAVTWADGAAPITGTVSSSNSLIGSTAKDYVGSGRAVALSNGDFVVSSPNWDNGGAADVGAVTWGSGTTGITGEISSSNSLVGATGNDHVGLGDQFGYGGVVALGNGAFVVSSPDCDIAGAADAGAVTWVSGAAGTHGVVSSSNSLVGSASNNKVGNGGVTALQNGNYVVRSPSWDNGATADVGAVTWVSGAEGTTGVVSASNSLVGSTANDQVGSYSVVALSNGNYVVSSPLWDNGAVADAGAVTWGSGTTGISGVVSSGNSLVGSTGNDQVGSYGAAALSNGNYVVRSQLWDNGSVADAGAATWGSGATGISGAVSSGNSLVGSASGDRVGYYYLAALSDGNYVLSSRYWDNGGAADAGAATWGSGTTGISGPIDARNSVVGRAANAQPGYAVADPVNNTFLIQFLGEGSGGRVTVAFADPNQLTFSRGTQSTVTVTPQRLTATLDRGTAVIQQASNDITVRSPIVADNPDGDDGPLTLQAGRSVLLDADITLDNGDLTLVANDTVAHGVVDAHRDSGSAVITMAVGTRLDLGTGTLTVALCSSSDKTCNDRGVATLRNVTASATILNDGTVWANGTVIGPVAVHSGAILGGTGTIQGAVQVASGGTLTAGDASIGTLTLATGPTLGGTTSLRIAKSGGTLACDRIAVADALTCGGALAVTAVGDPLAAGDTFDLFDATSFRGDFDTVRLPSLTGGLVWKTANLTTTGSIAVGWAEVTARRLFYNHSAFDGNDAGANVQDYSAAASAAAIAGHGHAGEMNEPDKPLDKQPLLPGRTATFVNYSSYAKGINGLLIALDELAQPGSLSAADFTFRVGKDDMLATWATAPAPAGFRVEENVIHPDFPGRPDVVTITWADEDPYTSTREPGAISNQWLQVVVLANAHTGLAADDVFYFGNQIGESGNSLSDTNVDQNDEIGARNHPHTAFNPAAISDPYDFNRDGKVDQNDEILVRNNPASAFTRIPLMTAPAMLQAVGVPAIARLSGEPLTQETLEPVVQEAISRWKAAGLEDGPLRTLRQAQFMVASYPGTQLGEASPTTNRIWLDDDAAGFGWFIDQMPTQDEQLGVPGDVAAGTMDLVTAVMHEMGHLLGRPDRDAMADDLMADRLAPGMRRGVFHDRRDVRDTVFAMAQG